LYRASVSRRPRAARRPNQGFAAGAAALAGSLVWRRAERTAGRLAATVPALAVPEAAFDTVLPAALPVDPVVLAGLGTDAGAA